MSENVSLPGTEKKSILIHPQPLELNTWGANFDACTLKTEKNIFYKGVLYLIFVPRVISQYSMQGYCDRIH